MKQFHPGEYSHKWRSVASNREFLKGQPIGDLIDDVDTNGVTSPVTVFNDTVVDGHHRVIAAAVSQKNIPYEVTNDDRYTDQVNLARRARIQGRQGMMPSSAPMDRRSVPPRLRSFLGWKP
jgi:hypothetical protein